MWSIKDQDYQPSNTVHFGNKYLIGNGVYGFRGTLDEARHDDQVGLNISNLYDGVKGKWRESINAWNPFFTEVSIDNVTLNPKTIKPTYHHQELNLKHALHLRKTTYEHNDVTITIQSERFLSMKDKNTMALKYTISASKDTTITLKTGIDTLVWELNGPHFESCQPVALDGIGVTGKTQECHHQITLLTKSSLFGSSPYNHDNITGEQQTIPLKANKPFEFYKVAVLDSNTALDNSKKSLYNQFQLGYDTLLNTHKQEWEKLWQLSDIIIEGDNNAQLALRYSLYHLLILTPEKGMSIPARGLSGQVYKGAVFWDTEIFMLPFYLHTNPTAAKELINYRINTLSGAKNKAKHYGYEGAFYAWESHEHGQDECSDFNIKDVFTNRDVRTYFKDKQIHISGDIVYALWHYISFTKDESLLLEGGAEVIFEVARFYLSYLKYNLVKDYYEVLDVVGPDEYHERVNNNAFTNKLVSYVFTITQTAATRLKELSQADYEKLNNTLQLDSLLKSIDKVTSKLKPMTITNDHVIEQFDGYFNLEDTTVETLKKRLVHPQEYWGTSHGVAYPTQIIKQADVVTMLSMFTNDYPHTVKQANFNYYHPRTEHGSSLSASMYGLLASEINQEEKAYEYFMKSATIDLTGKSKQFAGNTYIGGTHPASSGGAYMLIVNGFSGLRIENNNLVVKPRLPKHIKRITFNVVYQNSLYKVSVSHTDQQIRKELLSDE